MSKSESVSRLLDMGLSITQAAAWLDLEPKFLREAAERDEAPFWLQYCLNEMEVEFSEDSNAFVSVLLSEDLRGNRWSAVTARAAITILIENATRGGKPITYKDLDLELRRRDPSRNSAGTMTKYAFPLGIIGYAIEKIRAEARDNTSKVSQKYANIPPIECLVVNTKTQLPGDGVDGFMIGYLRDIGIEDAEDMVTLERELAVSRIQRDIASWGDWQILEDLAR